MKVLVIGAGAAGVAAAWRASKGAQVTVVHHHAGATALGPGAHDVGRWGEASAAALDDETAQCVKELGCWQVPLQPASVVSPVGHLRRARALDAALLNIAPCAGAKVGVTDLGRLGYDAQAWARALNAAEWAQQTQTRFEAVSLHPAPDAVRDNDYDFAALHDEASRVQTLGDALAQANAGYRAWLLPPSLGITVRVAEQLQQRLGIAVGECMSGPGGPAGARFEAARDALLQRLGATCVRARVVKIEPSANGWAVHCAESGGAQQVLLADRVIVACGGIVSGGLRLGAAREAEPQSAAFELALGLRAPLALGPPLALGSPEQGGTRLGQVASLYGFDLAQVGMAALQWVGVIAPTAQIEEFSGIFAAGEVIAGGPRSVLGAVQSGCFAARRALQSGS